MSGQNFDPTMLVGVNPSAPTAGVGGQPNEDEQAEGMSEGLKQMLGIISGYADTPGLSEGARMARQGIVQMLLALNASNQPSNAQMTAG